MSVGGIIEDYKVSVFRPEGVSVTEMNQFLKTAIIDVSFGYDREKMQEISNHPVKVSRDHPEPTHRKHAILD